MLPLQAAGYRHPSQMNGPRPPPPGGERPGPGPPPGQPGPPPGPPGPPGPPPGSMFQQQQLQQLKAQIMAYRLLARNQPIPTNYLNLAIAGALLADCAVAHRGLCSGVKLLFYCGFFAALHKPDFMQE